MNPLTIIIVNYNSRDYLEKCLRSIETETHVEHEIVVVDNGSEEYDFDKLRDEFPRLTVLCNDTNLGFAVACNQGIRLRPASFYLLLNPDALVLEGSVDKCLDYLKHRKRTGILGCRVLNPDGSLQLASRRSIPSLSSAFFRLTGLSLLFPNSTRLARYNLTFLDEKLVTEVESVSGSFLLFRHELLSAVGYLDENFFLYGEDLDFCYRTLLAGWSVVYFPEAQITHFKGRSSQRNLQLSTYHYYHAMKLFYDKYYGHQGRLLRGMVGLGIKILYWRARTIQLILKWRNN